MDTADGAQPCVGGGGWAALTPKDLARIGLLIATRGIWKNRRLISPTWLLDGHAGGNKSNMGAASSKTTLISWGQLTTDSLEVPDLRSLLPSVPALRRFSF